MQFDDRLATVLRSGAAGERAARTQFRQLLDLLGSTPPGANGPLIAAAYARLEEISDTFPATEQSRILREPGLRLRNARLVAQLALAEPQVAAAAMAAARLGESEWLELIPNLPMTARGFLRHRRDLPEAARRMLARLGVRDLVLPRPEGSPPPTAPPPAAAAIENAPNGGIGALVRRIEAFQKARRGSAAVSPRLPLDIGELMAEGAPPDSFDFSTDPSGQIDWADPHVAPLLVGLHLAGAGSGVCDASSQAALRRRGTIRGGHVDLPGAELIAGAWRLDATPRFDSRTGTFLGHVGRMRRPLADARDIRPDTPGDRMRQVLHELRTPVNAIQGFAEIIQQQLFGPAPNTYRALAGGIGVDAARLLAGFDEIDRLARLESGALALSSDGCNFRVVVETTVRRLEGVTRPRSAHLRLLTSGEAFTIGLGREDGALLAWRLLASLAGSLAPGEVVELSLRGGDQGIELETELPFALAGEEDPFAAAPRGDTPALTAGMFGIGFTLRLARAEAEAAGGSLERRGETLVLSLPALTGAAPDHSQSDKGGTSAAG
ncbi:MAG: histidine kinase dimerization/phospho-acceptor domain-containing protein [Croceibacterium sp.]